MFQLLSKDVNLFLQVAEDSDPCNSREETIGTHSEADNSEANPSGKRTVRI